jgi:hypothetical protein
LASLGANVNFPDIVGATPAYIASQMVMSRRFGLWHRLERT